MAQRPRLKSTKDKEERNSSKPSPAPAREPDIRVETLLSPRLELFHVASTESPFPFHLCVGFTTQSLQTSIVGKYCFLELLFADQALTSNSQRGGQTDDDNEANPQNDSRARLVTLRIDTTKEEDAESTVTKIVNMHRAHRTAIGKINKCLGVSKAIDEVMLHRLLADGREVCQHLSKSSHRASVERLLQGITRLVDAEARLLAKCEEHDHATGVLRAQNGVLEAQLSASQKASKNAERAWALMESRRDASIRQASQLSAKNAELRMLHKELDSRTAECDSLRVQLQSRRVVRKPRAVTKRESCSDATADEKIEAPAYMATLETSPQKRPSKSSVTPKHANVLEVKVEPLSASPEKRTSSFAKMNGTTPETFATPILSPSISRKRKRADAVNAPSFASLHKQGYPSYSKVFKDSSTADADDETMLSAFSWSDSILQRLSKAPLSQKKLKKKVFADYTAFSSLVPSDDDEARLEKRLAKLLKKRKISVLDNVFTRLSN